MGRKNVRLGHGNNVMVNKGTPLNKDGVPVFTCLHGDVEHKSYLLVVANNDKYYTNGQSFGSLHDAAESITDVEVDWKTFWKTTDGITVEQIIAGENNE